MVNSKPYQSIPEEILVRNIVFSAFSLIYAGVGILGLLISIILFGYRKMYRDIKQKLPSIQYVKPKLPPQPSIPKSLVSKSPTPLVQKTPKSADKQIEPVPTPPRKKRDHFKKFQ